VVGAELGGGNLPALVISNLGHFDLAALGHDKQALSFNSSYRTHLAADVSFYMRGTGRAEPEYFTPG